MKKIVVVLAVFTLVFSFGSCKRIAESVAEKSAISLAKKVAKEASEDVLEGSVKKGSKRAIREVVEEGAEAAGKKTLRELTSVSKEFKQLYESFSSRISKEFADDIAVTQEKQWTRMFSKKFPNSEIKTSGSTVVAKAGSTKSSGPVNEFLNHPLKNKTYMVDDAFVYETDDLGRTAVAWADRTKAYNTISRNTQRNSNIQKDVIRRLDGREGLDDAGHLFANNTGGPNELINQVPMSRELNRNGQWRKLEQMEEKALAAGKDVKSGRRVIYQGESKRPSAFEFISIIDGEETRVLIENI